MNQQGKLLSARMFTVDLRSLAVFRVTIGLSLLVNLAARFLEVGSTPSAQLAVPIDLVFQWPFSPYLYFTSASSSQIVLAAQGFVACCLIVGYYTRTATVVSWLMLLMLHHRNPFVLNGGDHLLVQMLFWGMFLPLGGRWSLDARRLAFPASAIFSVATAALLIQPCLMYFFSGLHKLRGEDWRVVGSAFQYALSLSAIEMLPDLNAMLLKAPALLQLLTYGTLVVELIAPLLLLGTWRSPRARMGVVVLFVFFHLGIAIIFRIGLFPWICIASLMPFIPTPFWNRRNATSDSTDVPIQQPLNGNVGACLGAVLLYVLAMNVWSLGYLDKRAGAFFQSSGYSLGILQDWSLFAPNPPHEDAWHECTGWPAGGRPVNLLFPEREVAGQRPSAGLYYPNIRWRKLLDDVTHRNDAVLPSRIASQIRESMPAVQRVRIVYHYQSIDPTGALEPVQSRVVVDESKHTTK